MKFHIKGFFSNRQRQGATSPETKALASPPPPRSDDDESQYRIQAVWHTRAIIIFRFRDRRILSRYQKLDLVRVPVWTAEDAAKDARDGACFMAWPVGETCRLPASITTPA